MDERTSGQPEKSKKEEVAAKVEQVTDTVKAKAGEVVGEAKTAAMNHAETRKDGMTSYVEGLATAVHSSADSLRAQGRERSAAYVSDAADSVSTFADRISHKSTSELLGEIEDFARERPALVFGAAMVAGFGLVRFLRSTEAGDAADDRPYDRNGGV